MSTHFFFFFKSRGEYDYPNSKGVYVPIYEKLCLNFLNFVLRQIFGGRCYVHIKRKKKNKRKKKKSEERARKLKLNQCAPTCNFKVNKQLLQKSRQTYMSSKAVIHPFFDMLQQQRLTLTKKFELISNSIQISSNTPSLSHDFFPFVLFIF